MNTVELKSTTLLDYIIYYKLRHLENLLGLPLYPYVDNQQQRSTAHSTAVSCQNVQNIFSVPLNSQVAVLKPQFSGSDSIYDQIYKKRLTHSRVFNRHNGGGFKYNTLSRKKRFNNSCSVTSNINKDLKIELKPEVKACRYKDKCEVKQRWIENSEITSISEECIAGEIFQAKPVHFSTFPRPVVKSKSISLDSGYLKSKFFPDIDKKLELPTLILTSDVQRKDDTYSTTANKNIILSNIQKRETQDKEKIGKIKVTSLSKSCTLPAAHKNLVKPSPPQKMFSDFNINKLKSHGKGQLQTIHPRGHKVVTDSSNSEKPGQQGDNKINLHSKRQKSQIQKSFSRPRLVRRQQKLLQKGGSGDNQSNLAVMSQSKLNITDSVVENEVTESSCSYNLVKAFSNSCSESTEYNECNGITGDVRHSVKQTKSDSCLSVQEYEESIKTAPKLISPSASLQRLLDDIMAESKANANSKKLVDNTAAKISGSLKTTKGKTTERSESARPSIVSKELTLLQVKESKSANHQLSASHIETQVKLMDSLIVASSSIECANAFDSAQYLHVIYINHDNEHMKILLVVHA